MKKIFLGLVGLTFSLSLGLGLATSANAKTAQAKAFELLAYRMGKFTHMVKSSAGSADFFYSFKADKGNIRGNPGIRLQYGKRQFVIIADENGQYIMVYPPYSTFKYKAPVRMKYSSNRECLYLNSKGDIKILVKNWHLDKGSVEKPLLARSCGKPPKW